MLTFTVLAIVIVVPALLYVPFIQDFAKDIALREVKKSTGMDITVDFLRLRFPLKVELDGVRVIEASGDTMATLGSARVGVSVLPLLHGTIKANGIDIDNLTYRLGTPDSAMCLTAKVKRFTMPSGSMSLKGNAIEIPKALLNGGDICLVIKDTVIPPAPVDTAAPSPLKITAGDITLRNVTYRMQMLPTIDSLAAFIPDAKLTNSVVDMGKHMIEVGSLSVDSVAVAYFTPSAQWLKEHPAKAAVDTMTSAKNSAPWTVTAGKLVLTGRQLVYGVKGAVPAPGLDMNYMAVSHAVLEVDSFFNRGGELRVPLKRLEASERCGLSLSAAGLFSMDSTRMTATNFLIAAGNTQMRLDGDMGLGTDIPEMPVKLLADARISLSDIEKAMPSLTKMLRGMPRRDISANVNIDGTMSDLMVNNIMVDWPSYLRLQANGRVANPTDFAKMNGRINIDGNIRDINFLKPTLLDAAMARTMSVPPTRIKGTIDYSPNLIDGDVALLTGNGKVALSGKWNGRATDYDATLHANEFPVSSFMPSLGIRTVSADLSVKGHGYNPMKASTSIEAKADLDKIVYQGVTYRDIALDATLSGGEAQGHLTSHNPGADLDADFTAGISEDEFRWNFDGDVRELDLMALGFSKELLRGDLKLMSTGKFYPKTMGVDAELNIDNLSWQLGAENLNIPQLMASIAASDSLTDLKVESGDLSLIAVSTSGLRGIMKKMSELTPFIDSTLANKELDVTKLQQSLPPLDFSFRAGKDNPMAELLQQQGIAFNSIALYGRNDSLINLAGQVAGFVKDKFRLDTIDLSLNQVGKNLLYTINVDNRPGTLDDFAKVGIKGYLSDDKGSILINQHNIKGAQGFYIGARIALGDTVARIHFVPSKPKIAYQQWEINQDNVLAYNFVTRHIDADLALTNGKSLVKIFTEHSSEAVGDSIMGSHSDDVVVQLSDIHLADWLSISPFAPPVKGDLGANLRFRWDKEMITGNGTVSLQNLYYDRQRVGTFDLNLNAVNTRSGAVHADIALMVDSVKVMTASGAINDSTASNPFLLDFSMIKFPLRTINPFLPRDVVQLKGVLNGAMKISGSMDAPVFNGYLDFDSTAVKVGMTGVDYTFSEEKIPVDSNVVKFNDFEIRGLNDNPLHVNGTVDARHLTNIAVDLALNARNMMIVNSPRPHGADIYGKAFIDVDANAKGNLSFMNVDASLALLPETDVTYVVTSSQSTLSSSSAGKMVTFVQFNDTTALASDTVQQSSMALNLEAEVKIEEGSQIIVDLSSDGKNKASIKGFGTLDYSLNPMNDGRLLGRFTINSGFVRYTPPLMSEKNFKFREGSYVNFTGDMLNPTLNITAVDEMKANVTQEGQNSRLVNFLVSLSVTRTLQDMNVAFDLSTNDDITVENELASMSPEQRANQAMNLLIYNVYTGPGTKASTNLSGNPLFSFLESQINSWAANNIRGVDISFGIDQYDKTTDGSSQTTTSYSYRVSKTLFNNKFKIVVGGNYSTDADADENFSQNLINDISFEYMLNRSGSMYVRLFRHVGYESILEGEVTQTGVGFVYRHKIDSLLDLFRWRRRKSSTNSSRNAKEGVEPAHTTK